MRTPSRDCGSKAAFYLKRSDAPSFCQSGRSSKEKAPLPRPASNCSTTITLFSGPASNLVCLTGISGSTSCPSRPTSYLCLPAMTAGASPRTRTNKRAGSGDCCKGKEKEKTEAKTLALAAGGSESDTRHIPIFKPNLFRSVDAEAQSLYGRPSTSLSLSSTSYSPHPSLSPKHRRTAARQSPNPGTRQSGHIRTRHGSHAGMTSSGPSKRRAKTPAVQARKVQKVQGGAYGRGEDEPEPEVDHSQPRSSNDHSYGHGFDQSTDNGGGEGGLPEGSLFSAQIETGRRQDAPSLHSRFDFDHTLDSLPADNGLKLLASADAESAKHSHACSNGHRHEEPNQNPKASPSISLYYNHLYSSQFKHSPEIEPTYKSELETDPDHAPTPAVCPSVSQFLRSRME